MFCFLYSYLLYNPFLISKKKRSANDIRCLSPPKISILYLYIRLECASRAHGFFPTINFNEESYMISLWKDFLVCSWSPIISNVFNIDSDVGERFRSFLSFAFCTNSFNSSLFFDMNFFCLFYSNILFIPSPFYFSTNDEDRPKENFVSFFGDSF